MKHILSSRFFPPPTRTFILLYIYVFIYLLSINLLTYLSNERGDKLSFWSSTGASAQAPKPRCGSQFPSQRESAERHHCKEPIAEFFLALIPWRWSSHIRYDIYIYIFIYKNAKVIYIYIYTKYNIYVYIYLSIYIYIYTKYSIYVYIYVSLYIYIHIVHIYNTYNTTAVHYKVNHILHNSHLFT